MQLPLKQLRICKRFLLNSSKKVSQLFFQLFFPPLCINCRKSLFGSTAGTFCSDCATDFIQVHLDDTRCMRCEDKLKVTSDGYFCKTCSQDNFTLKEISAAFLYSGSARAAILSLKFGEQPQLAKVMARTMFLSAHYLKVKYQLDTVIPAPIDRKRLHERGYNQALLLATPIANILDLPLQNDILLRKPGAKKQSLLNRTERFKNLRSIFSATETAKGKRILLIDDVITTGATAIAMSDTLIAAGAEVVTMIVFARA